MINNEQKLVSPSTYTRTLGESSYFKQGYEDYLKNKPFNYEIESKIDACDYERGRAFALYSVKFKQPRAIWRKKVLANTAKERLLYATHIGYIL
jgi:hypothetical protein